MSESRSLRAAVHAALTGQANDQTHRGTQAAAAPRPTHHRRSWTGRRLGPVLFDPLPLLMGGHKLRGGGVHCLHVLLVRVCVPSMGRNAPNGVQTILQTGTFAPPMVGRVRVPPGHA